MKLEAVDTESRHILVARSRSPGRNSTWRCDRSSGCLSRLVYVCTPVVDLWGGDPTLWLGHLYSALAAAHTLDVVDGVAPVRRQHGLGADDANAVHVLLALVGAVDCKGGRSKRDDGRQEQARIFFFDEV